MGKNIFEWDRNGKASQEIISLTKEIQKYG